MAWEGAGGGSGAKRVPPATEAAGLGVGKVAAASAGSGIVDAKQVLGVSPLGLGRVETRGRLAYRACVGEVLAMP